jgi:uncharacterized protein (DUF1697 family)
MAAVQPTRRLALLRGINVGGRNKLPMAELRALASGMGYTEVATYIASGNLLFSAVGSDADASAELADAIIDRFGFAVDVVVVSAEVARRAASDHPFADGYPTGPRRLLQRARDRRRPGCAARPGDGVRAGGRRR